MSRDSIDPRFISALLRLLERLKGSEVRWVVIGSLNHALQGLEVQPRDIDIMTDEWGAHEIERLLNEYVTRSVGYKEEDGIRSHFGELTIDGVKVELIGDMEVRSEGGGWSTLLEDDDIRYVAVGDVEVPLRSLEQKMRANLRLGRKERAERLRELIENQSS